MIPSPHLRALLFAALTLLALAAPSLLSPPEAEAGDTVVLKYACFAPEGSTYVRSMRAWDAELRERTGGKLSFRIYPGGVQGDERDMLRKVRVGQLHMVGMTGIGLGEVLPAIRILEMPAYYRDYAEVDAATAAAEPALTGLVREKGYELLGWGEAGTVHIFSNQPLRTLDDLAKTRMWAYEGDRVSAELFRVFNIKPVPLSIAEVLTGLERGDIDGVYGSPFGVVALQWSSHVKYMTQQSLGRAMGGTVIDARSFGALPADWQALLKETGVKYHAQIVESTRAENDKALKTLQEKGVQPVEVSPAEWNKLRDGAAQVRANLTGEMWSQDLLDTVDAAVRRVRAGDAPAEPRKEGARPGEIPTGGASGTGGKGAAP